MKVNFLLDNQIVTEIPDFCTLNCNRSKIEYYSNINFLNFNAFNCKILIISDEGGLFLSFDGQNEIECTLFCFSDWELYYIDINNDLYISQKSFYAYYGGSLSLTERMV